MMKALGRFYADAFRGLGGDVWRLAVGLLVNRAGTMVLPFLSLYLVRELDYDAAAASGVLFAFGLGSVFGSYSGGALSGRLGTVPVQIGSLALSGLGFLLLSTLRSFEAMAVGVFVVGALSDAYRPACMAAAVEASTPANRARALGLIRLAANSGMAIGPAAGGLLAAIDYRLIFYGESLTCVLAAVWLARSLGGRRFESAAAEEGQARGRSPWSDPAFRYLLALIFLLALVLFQIFSTLPLYLTDEYGLDERGVGLIFALNALLIVAFEMVLIKLLERHNPVWLLGLGVLLMCVGFSLLPLGRGMAFAAFTVMIWTAGEMLAFPFSNLLVAQRAGEGRTGEAMGIYSAVFSVAVVLAPVLGLAILDRFGGDVLWLCAGLMTIPSGLLTVLLARAVERHPVAVADAESAH